MQAQDTRVTKARSGYTSYTYTYLHTHLHLLTHTPTPTYTHLHLPIIPIPIIYTNKIIKKFIFYLSHS